MKLDDEIRVEPCFVFLTADRAEDLATLQVWKECVGVTEVWRVNY
jgi:hypothetical protein